MTNSEESAAAPSNGGSHHRGSRCGLPEVKFMT